MLLGFNVFTLTYSINIIYYRLKFYKPMNKLLAGV